MSQLEVDDLVTNNLTVNTETILPWKFKSYSTTTDAGGAWSIDYTGDFSSVLMVSAQAVDNVGAITAEKFASVHAFSSTAANGAVGEPQTIASLGLNGMKYCGSGKSVYLLGFGT